MRRSGEGGRLLNRRAARGSGAAGSYGLIHFPLEEGGVVSSSGFARFEVERVRFSGQGQVELQVRSLVGRDQYTSPTVLVNRGEYLVLTLSPELRFSQLTVRR